MRPRRYLPSFLIAGGMHQRYSQITGASSSPNTYMFWVLFPPTSSDMHFHLCVHIQHSVSSAAVFQLGWSTPYPLINSIVHWKDPFFLQILQFSKHIYDESKIYFNPALRERAHILMYRFMISAGSLLSRRGPVGSNRQTSMEKGAK